MSIPAALRNRPSRRGYLCEQHELRITRRCLDADIGADPDTPFERLLGREIVKGLVGKRCKDPHAGEPFTGHGVGLDLRKLRYGNDHRGCTWYDAQHEVVWLLAYGRHRSGDPDDAYPYMEQLGVELLPDEADYKALFDDRGERAAEIVVAQAQELLDAARRSPGREQRGELGQEAPVSVVVEVVETEEETCIAFSVVATPGAWVPLVPTWFAPESSADDWIQTDDFPTRLLEADEICLRYVKP